MKSNRPKIKNSKKIYNPGLRIKDLRVWELLFIFSIMLLLWTFFEVQMMKRDLNFVRFEEKSTQAINQIHQRTTIIENKMNVSRIPEITFDDKEKAKTR